MRLEDQNAVVYGGGVSIGGTVAAAFAREGARAFLASNLARLEEVAVATGATGGSAAEVAVVDALDGRAAKEHADAVAERAGGSDVSFNLISYGVVQGTPLAKMTPEDFGLPVATAMLKRAETLEDVGNVVAFVASNLARTMTATAIDISCGRVAD